MKISREEFLKFAIGAISFPMGLLSNPKKEKIAIIGAGASGLYSAYLLLKEGLDVEIFEASSLLGGRIRPLVKFSDFPVELGAEEVHGENSLYYDFIKKKGISLVEKDFENYYMLAGKLTEESQAELDSEYNKTQKIIQEISNYQGSDVSMQDYFSTKGISKNYMHIPEALVGNEYGTSLKNLGASGLAKSLREWSSGSDNFVVKSRSHLSIIEDLCERALKYVRLNTQITKIDYSNSVILLEDSAKNQYKATRVIVTVPISILRDGDIQFIPALPFEMSSAFSKIGMGPGMKIVLKFIRKFWEPNTGSIISDGIIPEYWAAGHRKSTLNNVLVGFVNGENAIQLGKSKKDIVKTALNDLDRIFGGKTASQWFSDSFVMDWSQEPFIRGTYSYPKVGEGNAREALAKPVKNKLFFAGEATHTEGHFGTIHGALETAVRAVNQVLEVLS
jgi:monoamine oxidase